MTAERILFSRRIRVLRGSREWLVFIGRRLVRLLASLVVVSFVTFWLLQLAPGSFAGIQAVGGGSTGLAAQSIASSQDQLQADYGSDTGFFRQYWNWFSGAVRLDFGPSYKYPTESVGHIIVQALPVSMTLAVLATLLALVIAIPVGVLAASRKGSWLDAGSMTVSTTGVALPNYLAAILLVLIFSLGLHALPTGGWDGPSNLVMPVIALAVAPTGVLARYVRTSVLEVLREEYVVAARARGGTRRTVLVRHVLRNSLIPLVTVVGPLFAHLTVGTVFVEQVFSIPGLGRYFTNAAAGRDMPLLMGTTMVFATILMVMNLLVDVVYSVLDPRTKASTGRSQANLAAASGVAGT